MNPSDCFLFHQLNPMGPLFHALFPSVGRLASCASAGKLRFRFGGLVQALPSFPPLRWSWSLSVGLRFSFLLPFQGLPAPGRVCWCLFSRFFPSLRSPLGFRLNSSHLIFTAISPPSLFHPHLHLTRRDLSSVRTLIYPTSVVGVRVCITSEQM